MAWLQEGSMGRVGLGPALLQPPLDVRTDWWVGELFPFPSRDPARAGAEGTGASRASPHLGGSGAVTLRFPASRLDPMTRGDPSALNPHRECPVTARF